MLLLRLETVATRSRKGRFECAWACTAGAVKEVLVGLRDVGYAEGVAWALLAAATALLARGIDEPAAKLLGAAEQILDETGAYIGPTERRLHEPLPAFIRDHGLDDARLSGYAMTLEEAVDLAVRSLD